MQDITERQKLQMMISVRNNHRHYLVQMITDWTRRKIHLALIVISSLPSRSRGRLLEKIRLLIRSAR